VITEDDLLVAAQAIGDMPACDVDDRLARLRRRRQQRAELAGFADQADLDAAELEEAAYQLARRYADDGNLTGAARWYRVAAARDFSDASLELARVLDRMAGRLLHTPVSAASMREEMDLVSEAARWYGAAYAAGHPEAAELLDELISRHDPARERTERPEYRHQAAGAAPALACSLGGLMQVMRCQLTVATEHIGYCRFCQQELLDHGGILPVPARLSAAPE
jgi:hypothetical protein